MTTRSLSAAAIAALMLAGVPAAAHADDTPTLTLNGAGVAFVVPDTATLSITARSGARTRTVARSRANTRTNAIVAALTKGGVARAEISTSGVRLSRTVRTRRPFYLAENDIAVRVTDVAKLGALIDAATHAGADSIDGPEFAFSDPSAGRAEATRNALADARRRADSAAAAAGQKVTGVRAIVIDPASGPAPYAAGGSADTVSAPSPKRSTPTRVSPGRQEVDATVQVVYTIGPA
jgi:uncharacterized protein YggE